MVIGKLAGGLVGYWAFGIFGAFAGLLFGHIFDRTHSPRLARRRHNEEPLTAEETEKVRQSFFSTTFAVMGHVAKADGRVQKSQIEHAENIMQQMGLTTELRSSAIALFNKGKQANFDLDLHLVRFRNDCALSSSLYRVFLEIQIQAALVDGKMAREEEVILLRVADVLGFPELIYRQIELLVRVSLGIGDNHSGRFRSGAGRSRSGSAPAANNTALTDAYAVLGVPSDANKATVKRSYRKLMNQHHPDKLVSKGLPEEMLKIATDKTQQIQKAYELIVSTKGW